MASMIQDLAATGIITAGNTFNSAISGTGALTTVDFADQIHNRVTMLATVSVVTASGNVTIKAQESTDDSTWTDVLGVDGLAQDITLSTVNTVQSVSFNVTKRYVRAYATLNSGTSVTAQILFVGTRQITPQNAAGGWVNESYS